VTYENFSNITITGGYASSFVTATNDSALLETSNTEGSYRITVEHFIIENVNASATEAGGIMFVFFMFLWYVNGFSFAVMLVQIV
jgi:hypothetical protein